MRKTCYSAAGYTLFSIAGSIPAAATTFVINDLDSRWHIAGIREAHSAAFFDFFAKFPD